MVAKTHTTIFNVRGDQLPDAWAKHLGLDIKADAERLVNVTLDLVHQEDKALTSHETIMSIVKRLQDAPVINPNFTEDSLYDEYGLPK